MKPDLYLFNTLSRKKELFKPINPPYVGMYVCGPTVYGEPHLGHARGAVAFDILFRYLTYLEYKVRYVRNITDVGHLENEETGEGEDRIAKRARLEQLEPMEVVQQYRNKFYDAFKQMNILSPSIEPQASGHIIEQQQLIREILDKGFAYESNGSVYFDVEKYHKVYNYGKLSGRKIEDLLSNSRELDGQHEKRSSLDFALWKKASQEHIMHWPSEWSEGFPGWHLECSTMGAKYLGEPFDIHGGGMDLLFPHHECEIAQSVSAKGKEIVKYWVHNNMITINNQKMSKSLGNFINLEDFFSGNNDLLDQPYAPMTIRFFMLQAHYRSTLDFSNEALKAAEKGLDRMFKALELLPKIKPSDTSSGQIATIEKNCFESLSDDLNTPVAISHLFELVKIIYSAYDDKENLSSKDIKAMGIIFKVVLEDILGIVSEESEKSSNNIQTELIDMLLSIRQQAKQNKDFSTADSIRNKLEELGILIKDKKDGFEWEWK